MEACVEAAKQRMSGLLEHMGIKTEVEGSMEEGTIYLELRGGPGGALIGKHGRTLDSLQMLMNRMVNKQLNNPVKVVLDVDSYRKRREDTLRRMVLRLGEKAKGTGQSQTIGPFNARERRIIHMALKEDPLLTTESLGEGRIKRITIIPKRKEGVKAGPLE